MTVEKRRLAAILAADVVGYSAMVAADEPATLARVRALRTDIIEPIAATHEGRLFKTMGDGFLLEFASAVQALRCAIAIQTTMREQPAAVRLRIGVHQGEVVPEGDDLLGDGVIVAARLEPLAEPGGIVISSRVREDASGKLALDVDDLGEPPLKNIAAKIRVFRVRMVVSTPAANPAVPAAADKPSIAVLPFQNMSGDIEQEYFADGIVEDIITELSRFRALVVIARNSTFTYKGKAVDVRQVARELSVRYVVEGSIRKAGNNVRITAQLIDATTGSHLWAERYDRSLEDVFAVQEDVTRGIVAAVAPSVELAEVARANRPNPAGDAARLAWRAQGLMHDAFGQGYPSLALEGIAAAEQALAADPTSLAVCRVLAQSHAWLHLYRWGPAPEAALATAWSAVERMLSIDPLDYRTLHCAGLVRAMRGETARGIADLRRAIEVNPNSASTLAFLAWATAKAGLPEEAKTHASLAIRLNPRDKMTIGPAQLALAMASYITQDYDDAVRWAELAIQSQPAAPIRRAIMIACCARAGDVRRAAQERAVLDGFAPGFVPSLLRGENQVFARPEDMENLLEGLRLTEGAGA